MQLNYHYFATAAKLDDVKKGLGSEMDYQLDWNVMKDVKLSAGYSIMRGTKSMDVVKAATINAGRIGAGYLSTSIRESCL